MELYPFILFLHVICALGITAGLAVLFMCEGLARRATMPEELDALLEREERTGNFMKSLSPILLLSGVYMAYLRWSVGSSWVIASFILLVYLVVTGPLAYGRRMRTAVEAATSAGGITHTVQRKLSDPVILLMGRMRIAFLALFVFLMTTKPGLAGTVAALGVALAGAALSGVVAKAASQETVGET